jgi:hypothetical protein
MDARSRLALRVCKGSLLFHARLTSFSVTWRFLLGLAYAKWLLLLLPQLHVKHAGFNGLFETLLRFEIALLSTPFSVPQKDVLIVSSFLIVPLENER